VRYALRSRKQFEHRAFSTKDWDILCEVQAESEEKVEHGA